MTYDGTGPRPIPEGWTEIGRVEMIKCLDENGELRLAQHFDEGITAWEALGMCETYAYDIRVSLNDGMESA